MVEVVGSTVSAATTTSTQSTQSNTSARPVDLSNYEAGRLVGQGAYGRVLVSKEKSSGRHVAIKEVSKDQIAELGKIRHIFREKELLNEMNHPMVIKLYGTTQDDKNLYFVFESCKNGDLANLIQLRGRCATRPFN